jgi:hypothetical protein
MLSSRRPLLFIDVIIRVLLLFVLLFDFNGRNVFAHSKDTLKQELILDLEIRPRAEFRDNYMLVPADSLMPEFYISQRSRIAVTYKRKAIKMHTSLQEIHLWNKSGETSSIGDINAYEFYIESTLTKNSFLRIGRQGLSLDNGRLFSAAPWSQQSRSHEGMRFFYTKAKIATDMTAAFTRNYSSFFDRTYSPVSTNQYKLLFVHHLKYKIDNRFTVTAINTIDLFKNSTNPDDYYYRATNGGRLDYSKNDIYLTVCAYYQSGRNSSQKNSRGYYIQPEVAITIRKTTFRLGTELLSGEDTSTPGNVSRSFVPLYGVAWKFMGNMNLFTRFPADVHNSGLINPYLFVIQQVNRKLSLRADGNLFYSQFQLLDANSVMAKRYLGFESDLSFNYKPIKNVDINFGLSFLLQEKSMELLGKVNAGTIPVWSYLMISFSPQVLHYKK